MIHIVPAIPSSRCWGGRGAGAIDTLRHVLGLDLPLHIQYEHYLWQLGVAILGNPSVQAPVRQIIFERYPATLQLAFLALVVCAAIAIPAGMLAAYRRGQSMDRAVGVFTLFGLAFPNFALGPVLILLFSIELDSCRFRAAVDRSISCCLPRRWEPRWPLSSLAWFAAPCSKSFRVTTCAPPELRASLRALSCIGMRFATR